METQNQTFRSKVFKWAHHISKSTGKAFAVCLAKAWRIYRLRKRMATQTVEIAYEKADGSLRKALATLNNIPYVQKGSKTANYQSLSYWDIQAGGFRSFKIENLIYAL